MINTDSISDLLKETRRLSTRVEKLYVLSNDPSDMWVEGSNSQRVLITSDSAKLRLGKLLHELAKEEELELEPKLKRVEMITELSKL